MKRFTTLLTGIGVCALAATLFSYAQTQDPMDIKSTVPVPLANAHDLSDEEWKEKLTPEQYRIARESGTERPNGAIYKAFKKHGAGTYYCVGCNNELFSSVEKFESYSGWPSFYSPSEEANVKSVQDDFRVEVRCSICDAHLGHVFKGEGFNTPTGLRYCINGTVLQFVPDEAEVISDEVSDK